MQIRSSTHFLHYSFLLLFILRMHTHMCVYVCAHMYHDIMWRSKVNVWELSLTFHHEGPEIELRPSSLVVR